MSIQKTCFLLVPDEEGTGRGGQGEEEVLPAHTGDEKAMEAGEAESADGHGGVLLQGPAQAQGQLRYV